jgi:hypothetical protein
LVYGFKDILPADVMWDSLVVEQYDEGISENSRRVDIDGLEEARCASLVQSARYLEGIRRYHDRNVKESSFNIGDLVLNCIQNTVGLHKLSSPWKVPSQSPRRLDQAHTASRDLKATTSATRGTSTSSVDSTRSLSTTLGVQVYTTTPGLSAVSGLQVQALVFGLLHSKIQRQRLLTDLGLLRASRTLAAVYQEAMYS